MIERHAVLTVDRKNEPVNPASYARVKRAASSTKLVVRAKTRCVTSCRCAATAARVRLAMVAIAAAVSSAAAMMHNAAPTWLDA